jgi:hypothetical protein
MRFFDVTSCNLVDMCHTLEGTCYPYIQMKTEYSIPPLAYLRHHSLYFEYFFALSHGFVSDIRYFPLIFVLNYFSSMCHNL